MDSITKQYVQENLHKLSNNSQDNLKRMENEIEVISCYFPERQLMEEITDGTKFDEILAIGATTWGPLVAVLSAPIPESMKKKSMVKAFENFLFMIGCYRRFISKEDRAELALMITTEILEYSSLTDDYATSSGKLMRAIAKAAFNSKLMKGFKPLSKPITSAVNVYTKRQTLFGIRQALIRYYLGRMYFAYPHKAAVAEAVQGYRTVKNSWKNDNK